MKNIFDANTVADLKSRIDQLNPNTTALWGKMNAPQMLAHCNVTYEMCFEDIHPKPKGLMKFILKTFVKPMVLGDKPYKKGIKTAPQFIITDNRVFDQEKERLIQYLNKTSHLGSAHFEGLPSHSFGKLSAAEWNIMFYKHLDHHLNQFGV